MSAHFDFRVCFKSTRTGLPIQSSIHLSERAARNRVAQIETRRGYPGSYWVEQRVNGVWVSLTVLDRAHQCPPALRR